MRSMKRMGSERRGFGSARMKVVRWSFFFFAQRISMSIKRHNCAKSRVANVEPRYKPRIYIRYIEYVALSYLVNTRTDRVHNENYFIILFLLVLYATIDGCSLSHSRRANDNKTTVNISFPSPVCYTPQKGKKHTKTTGQKSKYKLTNFYDVNTLIKKTIRAYNIFSKKWFNIELYFYCVQNLYIYV